MLKRFGYELPLMTKFLNRTKCSYYRPQTKLRKGNVFTPVCQSFCSQGVCIPACTGHTLPGQTLPLGRHPPGRHPPRQTHSWADTHPPGRHPSWADTHPLGRCTPPGQTPPLHRHPQADRPGRHPPGKHPPPRRPLQRTVRILLECILVLQNKLIPFFYIHSWSWRVQAARFKR